MKRIGWRCDNYIVTYSKGATSVQSMMCNKTFESKATMDEINNDAVYVICPKCGEELELSRNGIILGDAE